MTTPEPLPNDVKVGLLPTQELLGTCPWCGVVPANDLLHNCPIPEARGPGGSIACFNDDCPVEPELDGSDYETEAEAIAAWNLRTEKPCENCGFQPKSAD